MVNHINSLKIKPAFFFLISHFDKVSPVLSCSSLSLALNKDEFKNLSLFLAEVMVSAM